MIRKCWPYVFWMALLHLALLYLLVTSGRLNGQPPLAPVPRQGIVSPFDVVKAALVHARTLDPTTVKRTRYFDARVLLKSNAIQNYGVFSYHVNSLSQEVEIKGPERVTPWLWSVNIDDYRWPSFVFGDLAKVNFYYSIPVTKVDGLVKTEAIIPNPIFADLAELVLLTGSQTPIVRADEFLVQTGAQVDRAGHGYYDWFGFKARKDMEQLAALDRTTAEKRYREYAAIIPQSGVGNNNRQVFWYSTLVGPYWETRDTTNNRNRRNAATNLLDDFQHDAQEIVFTLPNGLPGYYLSDDKGKQIDSVPDTIAHDHESTNNDRRIHVAYSCIGCHFDSGLRPIKDYSRQIYDRVNGTGFATLEIDLAKSKRLQSVYLGPLQDRYTASVAGFSSRIELASGLKPEVLARAYRRLWSEYLDKPVTPGQAAFELGRTPEQTKQSFDSYAKSKKGIVNPVFVGFFVENGPGMRREYFEEQFPVMLLITNGGTP
jgi:hypothetical protein